MVDPKTKAELKSKGKSMWASVQDAADVASAKLRRDEGADIEVAIIKATLNDTFVPKEKHVVTLKLAVDGSSPRQQVNFVIAGLANRLAEGKDNWLMTLKTLVVFHRLMREVDSTFQEEILKFGERTSARRMLRLDGFADHTTKDTWDYSAWIRLYSVYLDERLETFRAIKFDAVNGKDTDALLKMASTHELLERLPVVHKLLSRLVACVPVGSACANDVVIASCSMVLEEVRPVYKVVCEGVMNLADKFFEMERADAVRGLEVYKENVVLNDKLNVFFNAINSIATIKGQVSLPTLQTLPTDFQQTLEEYVRDAPRGPGDAHSGVAPSPSGTAAPAAAGAAAPTAASLLSAIRAGGVTSSALGGASPPTPAMPPSIPAPPGISLHIGAPKTGAPVAPPPPAAPASVPDMFDLLGADLSEMAMAPAPAGPPAAAGAGSFWGDNAFGAPPAVSPTGMPSNGSPGIGSNGVPGFAATSIARQEIPLDLFASPPPAAAPPAQYPGYSYPAAPAPAAANPFVAPAGFGAPPPPAAANPFQATFQAAPAPVAAIPVASSSNPFTDSALPSGAAPVPASYAPPQQQAWSQNHDPLAGLGDLLGKPAPHAPQQSLKQMRKL
ncbi:hypothetical protein FOA52_010035 [Chlamydomonas sp. UWO 241]|nr:hypothetical protein FOA52_010035 [Chlamydomonas sp. UWO 241]